jgi:hypothetical protein
MAVEPTRAPTETVALTQPSPDDNAQGGDAMTVDVRGVAQRFTSQVVAAVPVSADAPWWQVMPQYTLLTLEGYPISNRVTPQIYIYPVKDLGVNQTAQQAAQDLQVLLQSRQTGETLPCLPLLGDVQMMHAQVQYLDFQNGKGVRFLTQYANGIVPINNHELFYAYQGLTDDGLYYVAVVLAVNLPGLPADATAMDGLPTDFMANYLQYKADTVGMLDQQPASAYSPDLSTLDAMMQSMVIK